jgi:flagellar hook assembly protein FlgD
MYVRSVNSSPQIVGQSNPNIVANPDPNNPLIRDPKTKTDGQTFMKLMIEQLKNQDPMNPMKSDEFTSQMAQLNSLEQLISLNTTLTQQAEQSGLANATAMIGNYVEGLDANGTMVSGYAERVEMIDSQPVLKVGDKMLLLNQIISVAYAAPGDGGESL